MLDQLKEGLRLYGLAELLNQYPEICMPLFVAGQDIEANAEFVMSAISPELSEKGTYKYQVEVKLVNFLQDLYEFEENPEHAEDGCPRAVTTSTFLQWLTGQGHVPLLPSEKNDFVVALQFNHDCSAEFGIHSMCYPVVSAFSKTIVLPVKHMTAYDQFRGLLLEAFHLGQEFHKV
ncbi:hypothetical protein ATANTOWER_015309 [Ataeniobius toweri]|uniref:HECT domain-containing protein n=1 Tax=Ataeniobius toweri TaxID=208326 RepID=A0ABU7B6T2_9TELE|nr:hypothetical protein [Ataeniobius toweri]